MMPGFFVCVAAFLRTRMKTAIVALIHSGIWIVAAESLHAVFHSAAATALVVAGLRIIPIVHDVGSAAVVATVIRCCERAADERTGKKSAANTPAPAAAAPTTTAPATTAPATNPSGILDRYRRCVLDRERTTSGSRRGNCIRRRGDSTHGRRDEYRYRL